MKTMSKSITKTFQTISIRGFPIMTIDFLPITDEKNIYLTAALLILVCIWLVLRSRTLRTLPVKLTVIAIRVLVVLLIALIAFNPVSSKTKTQQPKVKQVNDIWLFDNSASMNIGGDLSQQQQMITHFFKKMDKLPEKSMLFGDRALNVRPYEILKTEGAYKKWTVNNKKSHICHALRTILQRPEINRIYLVSDGWIQDRKELRQLIRLLTLRGVSIYPLIVSEQELKPVNATIISCDYPEISKPGETVEVKIGVEWSGSPSTSAKISLNSEDLKYFKKREVTLTNGTNFQTFKIPVGDKIQNYSVTVEADTDEISTADNAYNFRLKLDRRTIRVLYMEGSITYQVYPSGMNGKSQKFYELFPQAFAQSGDIECDMLLPDRQNRPSYIYNIKTRKRGYPTNYDDLRKYDVIICSDIKRSLFSQEQLDWTRKLVAEQGAGFCMIGGLTSFGAGDWDKTVWEKMIPVDMVHKQASDFTKDFTVNIPNNVRNHPILQLSKNKIDNNRILNLHPHFRGSNVVNRAKPGATVLIEANIYNQMPLVTVQPYGKGRSMAFASDAAGGWGRYYQAQWGPRQENNEYYQQFWINTIKWLAENSQRSIYGQVKFRTERLVYSNEQTIKFSGAILNSEDKDCHITVKVNNRPAVLKTDSETSEFKGEFKIPENYNGEQVKFEVSLHRGSKLLSRQFFYTNVINLAAEYRHTGINKSLLQNLARATRGSVIRSVADYTIFHKNEIIGEKRTMSFTTPLWDTNSFILLLFALFGLEWYIRKKHQFRHI